MTWEYKIVYFGLEGADEDEYEKRLHESAHLLNKFGSDGWELIAFLPHQMADSTTRHHAVFKRQKVE
jgi:hypothetical protein